jgi:NifU-like protein involved in Fe-S cluster formation
MAASGLRAMLQDGAEPPVGRFSDLAMLEPVKAYPARHASTMLAFEAAAEAVRAAKARTSNAGAA